jgi:hypothetical protein
VPGSRRAARTALCAMTMATLIAAGCGVSSSTTDDSVDGVPATTTPAQAPTASATTTAATYRTRSDLGMKLNTERAVFTIDGASGTMPQGWEGAHIRAFYVFLGYNTAKQPPEYNWLSVDVPSWTGIGPPGPSPVLEPTPPDILAQLAERSVEVSELGTLTVDGVQSPVIQVGGYLHVCGRDILDSCRWNTPSRFYILVPYTNGELVVEGESDLLSKPGAVSAEQAAPLVTALQTWADTIDLP